MAILSTDIVDWLLGDDGDIVVGQDVQWSVGLAAVVQSCDIAVQMVRGEWFLNDDEGVPYWERPGVTAGEALLGAPFNALKATAAFRAALLAVPQVITILKLECNLVDKAARKMRVTFQVRTTFGDTPPVTVGNTGGT